MQRARLAITEGRSGTYTLRLNSQPSGPVTVAVAAPTNTDVTRAPGSLTYAAGAWNTAQTVTVSVASDADELDESAMVSHTAASGDSSYNALTASMAVTGRDTHLVLSETALAVTEGTSPTATYTVKLSTQPTGGVQVQVARGGGANYVLNQAGGTQGASQTLTFSTTTWDTAQAITVIALDDDNALGSTSNITHATVDANTAAEYDPVSKNLPLTVTDDDAALVVSRGSGALALTEGGAATYTVTLKGSPSGSVVVDVTSDDAVAVGPGALTYSGATWNTGQTVTVTAQEDGDDKAETAAVTHAVNDGASADEFDPADDVTFTVSVTDNDTPGLAVGATNLTTNGVGEGATATLRWRWRRCRRGR